MGSLRTHVEQALAARYAIESELGTGAAATVYLARDLRHDRRVAIKVLHPELAAVVSAERFLNEIRLTARLDHPNVIPLYDSGDAAGFPYYVMPAIDGESLRQKLDREKQLGIQETLEITRGIAAGLTHAHSHSIVHRDIKPENILLHHGIPLIADFGVAKAIGEVGRERLTGTGVSIGTPSYMSPEQARGESEIGPRSDIYSLATVLYEMLAGDPPFTGSHAQAIMAKVINEAPTRLRLMRDNVPASVDAAVQRALQKVPGDRFATAAEFVVALGTPAAAPALADVSPPPQRDTLGAVRVLHFVAELKRRRVVRTALWYAGAAFVILQGAPPVVDALPLPAWTMDAIVYALLLIFPIALMVSWAFQLTRRGDLIPELPASQAGATMWQVPFWPRLLVPRSPALIALAVVSVATVTVWRIKAETGFSWLWWQPALDSTLYVVFPQLSAAGDPSVDRYDDQFHEAFARWKGIVIVNPFTVREHTAAWKETQPSGNDEQRTAQAMGAGRYTRLTTQQNNNGVRIHATLHDTRSGRILAAAVAQHHFRGALPVDSILASVAATLLFRAAGIGEVAVELARGTTLFPAAVALLRGHEALLDWNLDLAIAEFERALQLDGDYVRAALWAAQSRNWRGEDPVELRALIDVGASRPALLATDERLIAAGLVHLSQGAFAEACASYSMLIDQDSSSFAGWYGRGECHARDWRVIADPTSPSKWSFRSSYHQAALAYHRAFLVLPSGRRGINTRTVDRVKQVLFTSTNKRRLGSATLPAPVQFGARPEWLADTLALVPYLIAVGRTAGLSSGVALAVDEHRRLFRQIATAWATTFPTSAYAREAVAIAQDMMGDPEALATLQEARQLATDPRQSAQIAHEQVLLLVKLGIPHDTTYLERARSIGDSLLRYRAAGLDLEARTLAVVAALLGRVHVSAQLSRVASRGDPLHADSRRSLDADAEALMVYAVFGGPADTVVSYENRIEEAIRNRLPVEQQADVRFELLGRTASLAFPHGLLARSHQLTRNGPYPLLHAQAALLRQDTARAREILVDIEEVRRRLRSAQRTLDAVFPEASLWAALGDTAVAARILEATLDTLRWSEPRALDYVDRAAALVWMMVLRADLANAAGDTDTAARWATPVTILWATAERRLQHVVARMRELKHAGRGHMR